METRRVQETTAALVVIGDEILSGAVADANIPWLAAQLRQIGVRLRRVLVVADVVGEIGEAVGDVAGRHTYVFTSGGVGPTHDDVTMAGVAAGLGRRMARHQEFEALIRAAFGEKTNEHLLAMADLPEGARLEFAPGDPFPTVAVANLFVLPGVPQYFRSRFNVIRGLLHGTPLASRRVYTTKEEPAIAGLLADAEDLRAGVRIGSYPVYDRASDYRVMITVESLDPADADAVRDHLVQHLGPEAVARVG
ncbi:MAG: competence/damage-inducible protein A [Planctomycetes bacterium]|nr:competence/damage-inducible protein A [Planctomycetota bacterium]